MNVILICLIPLLLIEIYFRFEGPNSYSLLFPRFLEIYHQYDSHLGWVGKPNTKVQPDFYGSLEIDERGFAILPNVKNDKIRNNRTIAYLGRCDTYVGGDKGPEKNFMNLLAGEIGDRFDFEVMGYGGYTLYQDYLLAEKYNHGQFSLIIVPVYPEVDFYLDTPYVKSGYKPLVGFNNRLCPHPRMTPQGVTHSPVPYIKSFWDEPPNPSPHWTPDSHSRKNLSFKEKLFLNCYSLSKLLSTTDKIRSFDPLLTRKIVQQLNLHTTRNNGRLVLMIINLDIDKSSPQIVKEGDEFISWLKQNKIDYIDLRQKLKGYSMAKTGDPYHISVAGEVIRKDEIINYLKKSNFLVTN